jgi:hypothetical protein
MKRYYFLVLKSCCGSGSLDRGWGSLEGADDTLTHRSRPKHLSNHDLSTASSVRMMHDIHIDQCTNALPFKSLTK